MTKIAKSEHPNIVSRYLDMESAQDIADDRDVSRTTIRRILKKYDTPMRGTGVHCRKHGMSSALAQNSYLKRKYRMTLEDFAKIHATQDGKCMICGREMDDRPSRWTHLDHSHPDGVMRGILCVNCNRGIGVFQESIETLKRAIVYLECESFDERIARMINPTPEGGEG